MAADERCPITCNVVRYVCKHCRKYVSHCLGHNRPQPANHCRCIDLIKPIPCGKCGLDTTDGDCYRCENDRLRAEMGKRSDKEAR